MSKFKVGDRVEYTGLNDSLYFTNGLVYEVVGESGPDMWYLTDNEGMASNGGNGHAWPKREFHESFRLAGPVRTETVTTRHIVPGVYGRLCVAGPVAPGVASIRLGPPKHSEIDWHDMTAEELDSLAMVASQLAEALRDA